MFELNISKCDLLNPLLMVSGALDRKQPLPILSHLLLSLKAQHLILTATDLEIEITARIPCQTEEKEGAITVSAKKFLDIIRSLDDKAIPRIVCQNEAVSIKEGRSHFKLATLPADDYPYMQDEASKLEVVLPTTALTRVLQCTHFAMSQQDVRVFLNGLFLEFDSEGLTAVATDGHRMAVVHFLTEMGDARHRLLVPRKAVQDMLRLLQTITDETVTFSASEKHVRLVTEQYTFSSKLVEARFPPYTKAIPRGQDKSISLDRDALKRALSRIVILAHEKSKAILLHLQPNLLTLIANNQEKEEAVESLEAETEGDELKIGINAGYLLDVLAVLPEGAVKLSFSTTDSSILVESPLDEQYQYIIMPMKI
ncbi:MAG: DNA polymerase III subunit beta [Gammaproteobacteria bacterium]|nr:DNA polymerase III subunit beta [Gammaproteobacteria bacterium]